MLYTTPEVLRGKLLSHRQPRPYPLVLSGFFLGPKPELNPVECLNQASILLGSEIDEAEVEALFLDKLLECHIDGHVISDAGSPGWPASMLEALFRPFTLLEHRRADILLLLTP
jgi:hypothetical protein